MFRYFKYNTNTSVDEIQDIENPLSDQYYVYK